MIPFSKHPQRKADAARGGGGGGGADKIAGSDLAHIEIAYDGSAVRDGSMDVEDLAPALLGVAALCKRANDILNGGAATVTINARSDFRRASFGIDLDVIQVLHTTAVGAISLFTPENIKSAKEIAAILGLLIVGDDEAFTSLLGVIKLLRGKPPEKIEKKGDTYEIHSGGGDVLIVSGEVGRLIENKEVLEAAHQALRPLEKKGISSFQVKNRGSVMEELTPEVLPIFNSDPPLLIEAGHEVIADSTTDRAFLVVKPSFDPTLVWRLSDGLHGFDAHMDDDPFLRRVVAGDETFSAGTLMKARVQMKSVRTPDGRLKTEYRIKHVYGLERPPVQTLLE
ncbi:MAG: hypothetical protein M3041_16045 [Acidobacteriota bacterium]|nr:hypothetical protein [Acidobacteriota bacterium]